MTALLLTTNDVASLLRVSESTVRRLIRRGELPATRVGGLVRVHRDAVERYAAADHDLKETV